MMGQRFLIFFCVCEEFA